MSHGVSRDAPWAGAAEGKCRERSHPAPTRSLPRGHAATPGPATGGPSPGQAPAHQPGLPQPRNSEHLRQGISYFT